ncbi:MFS transporter [Gordonia crocea]|uniref:Uncharacterized protein n=1 Tax=Gordonia crocea TaxID=589162 RepID=A0A7I9UW96_9ACTN|nr:MFS transporter [Gordonia crocea]GED97415.1 hypothetical protein nbrc107697_14540 [Gordonia crocea]
MVYHHDGIAPTAPTGEAHIRGAAPKSWRGYIIAASIAGGLLLGAVVCLALGFMGGFWNLGLFGVIIGIGVAIAALPQLAIVGRIFVTAGPQGLHTLVFDLPWADVSAYEFVDQNSTYNTINAAKTKADQVRRRSIVITRKATDQNGRPIQWGYTLPVNHTTNYDEFHAAVRAYAPQVRVGSALGAGAYQQDPGVTAQLRALLAQYGYLDISRGRGKTALQISPTGMAVGENSLPWNAITALAAVTDVHTTSYNGVKSTERTPRLVVITNHIDPKTGEPVVLRPAYPTHYQPTIEQIVPLIVEFAPHVTFGDRRTG